MLPFLLIGGMASFSLYAQHSVARQWNEVLLDAIRGDYARPTVHARNLFHISAAMYDAWAIYEDSGDPYLLGNTRHGYKAYLDGVPNHDDRQQAQETAISYAAFRLITHRFSASPQSIPTQLLCENLMSQLGLDPSFESLDYAKDGPAALGNYIAHAYIEYGLQDGSNERQAYGNTYYTPANPPLEPTKPGNPDLQLPNLWQPLLLDIFVDQSGNEVDADGLPFLGPEWGKVAPFSLTEQDLTLYERDGFTYYVYHDPGPPALIDENGNGGGTDGDAYQWGFSLVARWSSHLDQADGVMWDISPASIGNVSSYPTTLDGLKEFFGDPEGGDPGQGHELNPYTGQAYEPNVVPRGDYARVLAEFWADGPDSETPPGHWFTILNYVSDHPANPKKFMGQGPPLPDLEWDVKAYFVLGGAMHDAAISAWGVKGYYDYIRPVSAIRWMADQGQRSDPTLPGYDPMGIPLYPGQIEVVTAEDPLAGSSEENVGKIKLYAWKGPDYIGSVATDQAGVDWILAEDWWPYQRPNFVTPPFAGYVSGHSTFSRAAAEVLTAFTGDEFFPGGMGEFIARKNEFLVFEEGPSVDVTLQWATYRDASDQTSLSRIWGGIHPPVDDIPGRLIGEKVGKEAFAFANSHFEGKAAQEEGLAELTAFPNPVSRGSAFTLQLSEPTSLVTMELYLPTGKLAWSTTKEVTRGEVAVPAMAAHLPLGLYYVVVKGPDWESAKTVRVVP